MLHAPAVPENVGEERRYESIGALAMKAAAVASNTLVPDVARAFFADRQLDALAIVDGETPAGLVTRHKLFFQVFRQYGWEIYKHRPISELIDAEALSLSSDTALDEALGLALSRRPENVYDDIIVLGKRGNYCGLLSVRRMVIEQSQWLANIIVQRNMADERARELERIGELKSQFLATVTHELRSPVNAVIELADLINVAAETSTPSEMRERLALLLTNAMNLRSVITNMLDLSKIEAGRMQVIVESFDLIPLLHDVLDTGRVLAGTKPIEFEIVSSETSCPMYTDSVKVRQLVLNLVSNAVKFTESGRIAIRHSSEGEFVSIDVTDTGSGIAPDDLGRLFIAFSQLEEAKTKRHEGTGLGLTITRQLAHLLGGSVAVQSTLGKGSCFSVQLPRRFNEEQREIA